MAMLTAVMITLLCVMSGCGKASSEVYDDEPAVYNVAIKEITKRGNVLLDTTFDDMKANDMEIGDLITVIINEASYDIPIGTSYTDVDSGDMICRFDLEDNKVTLAVNWGNFALEAGIGEMESIEADPGYQWNTVTEEVGFILKEKKGYLDEYNARNLERSNVREDYPDLTDEEYANFRAIDVTGIRKNILYRSSSPLDPSANRAEYAMKAMENAGIQSALNLHDSYEEMRSYDAYSDSYYANCTIFNPEMSYDYTSEEFSQKVKDCLLFIIDQEGPYLIHCKEGKDRTGILCAVIECFAGATAEEIKEDYMLTYEYFYGLKQGDTSYGIILKNFTKQLNQLLQTDDFETADLKQKATEYLLSIGISADQLDMLENKLKAQ